MYNESPDKYQRLPAVESFMQFFWKTVGSVAECSVKEEKPPQSAVHPDLTKVHCYLTALHFLLLGSKTDVIMKAYSFVYDLASKLCSLIRKQRR